MPLNNFEKFLGTGFYTGYIPFAPGTFGSAAALLIYLIPGFENLYIIIPAIILFTLIGIPIGTKFESVYGKDPSQCTIDEVIGMWISLLFLPKIWWVIVVTFIVWRIMDIVKPFPANFMERLSGGRGIIFDDIVAALYTSALMHLFLFFINK
ncbi:MAG: phosphatidylglycerophosphatase A [Bacteroidetes bacterium]|nr:phosphatidylglycerophosphatase A [Bacteroidota bacterium]MBU1678204.1 phosphatidylglycerophosphatase A [Bacteroidota bacterium]MBU2507882.1 phosphatidylglycerophosphatase A [Bacteroidota bacterium]